MATFDKKSFLVIFVFWVALPTLDMFSDIKLFHKFFSGPAPDTVFYGIGLIPFPEPYNGTYVSLTSRNQHSIRLVEYIIHLIHNVFNVYANSILKAYQCFGIYTLTPVVLNILMSLCLSHKLEKDSNVKIRLLLYLFALIGLYPQFLASR